MKRRTAIVLGMFASLSAIAAETTISDNIEIAAGEPLTVDVASGDTATYSGIISGEGSIKKTGAGTLVLSAANEFSGGIALSGGKLVAGASGAFGTGLVNCTGSSIEFTAVDGAFPNDFKLGNSSATPPTFTQNTTLNGKITLVREHNFYQDSEKAVFNGAIDGSKNIIYRTKKTATFNGALTLNNLYGGSSYTHVGVLELRNPDNRITNILLMRTKVRCCAANVMNGSILTQRGKDQSDAAKFYLQGYDQTVKACSYDTDYGTVDKGGVITSENPATLTIAGTGAGKSAFTYYSFSGQVSIDINADATFTQRFSGRASTTTGEIKVTSGGFEITGASSFPNVGRITVSENGVFMLNSTAENALHGVETLKVDGRFSVGEATPFPFGNNLSLELGEGAELSLPEGMTLLVKSLSTNGVPVMGRINAGTIPQLSSGVLVVEREVSDNLWVGGGASGSIAMPQNWKDPANVDVIGNMGATFADPEATGFFAYVDEDVTFRHMILSSANGFGFDGDGTVTVSTGMVAVAESDSAPVYSFRAPLHLGVDQLFDEGSYFPVSVASGATLKLEGDTASSMDIKKTGAGVLDISGSNVWDGALIVSDGNVKISGTITTSAGVDERTSVSRNGAGVLTLNMSPDSGATADRYLTVSNAVIEKPIWFAMGESSSTPYFNFPAGTTNIFKAYFCNDDQANQRFRTQGKDTVVSLQGGGHFPWNFYITGLGTVFLRNKTFSNSGGGDGLAVQGNEYGTPTAVFEVAGNSLRYLTIRGEGGTIDMRVDNALGSSTTLNMYGAHERTKQGSVLLLNGTSQTIGCLKATAAVNAYSRIEGDGATLSIVNNSASSASSCRFRFVGDVSLNFNSPGTMMLTNAVSSSCGRLGVERGTVTLAYDAAWTNVGEVAVSGTGKLKVDAKEGARTQPVFGKDATLVLADDGVLDIADGLSVRVKHLFVNGVKMPRGIYSWSRVSDENVRKHFVEGSTGVVSVRGEGSFTVTVR